MKKLFLFAALLMTGFAFYSCEDVVDNPAQDPAQSWNYSVSVKFDNFTGVTYQAPTTLYVINEENTLMGTITTDAAPAAGDYGTYAGTLTGSIGNNLTITTKIGNDLAKQDGTLASAVENGIVQTADVPIKIYNANSGTLTTAAAKLENTSAIVKFKTNALFASDKLTFTAKDQAFEIAINEEFDPTVGILYAAVPATGTDNGDITIAATSKDGFMRGYTLNGENYPVTKGVVTDYSAVAVPFEKTGVDLTVWDAYMRENDVVYPGSAGDGYMKRIKDGLDNYFYFTIPDDKSFNITQSGAEALDSLNIAISGNVDKDVALSLNNIQLTENHYFEINNGAKFELILNGANKFDMLNLNSPFTKKGDGTWEFKQLNIGGSTSGYDAEGKLIVNYAAEYTINEDIDLEHLSASNGGKLTIAEGKKVNVVNENGTAISIYMTTVNVGKDAIVKAETKRKDGTVIYMTEAELNIGENAELSALGAKNSTALEMRIWSQANNTLNIGKNAKVNLVGGPAEALGYGMIIDQPDLKANTNINLDEGATLYAKGIDRAGIAIQTNYYGNNDPSIVNFKAAKNAKIVAEDTEAGLGLSISLTADKHNFNFDGEGTFEVKSKDGLAMNLNNNNGTINFKGGNISVTSGADKPAVWCSKKFTIAPEIKSFKATKGADATLYISQDGTEAKLEDLVADKTKFNDETADGARTITPKPAAE